MYLKKFAKNPMTIHAKNDLHTISIKGESSNGLSTLVLKNNYTVETCTT